MSTQLYLLGLEPLDLGNDLRIPNLTLSVKSNFTDEEIEDQSLDFLPKVRNESQIRIQAVWFQSLCFYLLFYGCVYMYVCVCASVCVYVCIQFPFPCGEASFPFPLIPGKRRDQVQPPTLHSYSWCIRQICDSQLQRNLKASTWRGLEAVVLDHIDASAES